MWGKQASLDPFVTETLRKVQNNKSCTKFHVHTQPEVLFTSLRSQIVVMYIWREYMWMQSALRVLFKKAIGNAEFI